MIVCIESTLVAMEGFHHGICEAVRELSNMWATKCQCALLHVFQAYLLMSSWVLMTGGSLPLPTGWQEGSRGQVLDRELHT